MMLPFPATERGISAAELSDRKMITDRVPIFLEIKIAAKTTSGFLHVRRCQPHIVPKNDQDNPQSSEWSPKVL